jgi:RimJ/RimL family protein N-acetyltransferase
MMFIPNSQRLSYRLMNESDADLLFQLDQDPQVMRFINGGKPTTQQQVTDCYIPRLLSYLNPSQGWGQWNVSVKESGQYIGWILIRPMNFFSELVEYSNLEIGWRFFQSAWGKGYASEAAESFVKAFRQASLEGKINPIEKLSAIAMPDNAASIAIMKKIGMSYHKTAIHRDPLGDEEVVYYQKNLN